MNVRPVCLQGDFTDLQGLHMPVIRAHWSGSGRSRCAKHVSFDYWLWPHSCSSPAHDPLHKAALGAHMPKLFAATLVALAAMLATPDIASAQVKLRIAGNFTLDHSSTIAIEQFKKDVEAATGNAIIIETFPNMQLGGAQENVTQTRAGTIAATWVGMAFLARTVPELEAVSLPFMFPNRQVAYRVMDSDTIGKLLESRLADKGFVLLGFMELGARQVTNGVRPIKTIADLKGLKIRMQPNETHLATFRALGASPSAMDIKEVYSA